MDSRDKGTPGAHNAPMSGYLTLTVQLQEALPLVAQRVLCWAGKDAQLIQTTTVAGGRTAVTIPDEVFDRHGPLYLKTGGPDIKALNKPRLYQSINVGNGDVVSIDPNTCKDCPTVALASTDGYTYTATVASGVSVDWGDGTSSVGSSTHRYRQQGKYQVTLTKGAETSHTWLLVPSGEGITAPAAPCPELPTITSFTPGCHWAYDGFTMTITGTTMADSVGFTLVSGDWLLVAGTITHPATNAIQGRFGEIEYNDQGSVMLDVWVRYSTGIQIKAPTQFRLQPAGQVC